MALSNEHLGSCWLAIGHGAICHSRCQPPPMSHRIGKGCGLGLGGQRHRQDEEGEATLQVKRRAGPSPQSGRESGVWRRRCLPCSYPSFRSPLRGPPQATLLKTASFCTCQAHLLRTLLHRTHRLQRSHQTAEEKISEVEDTASARP